MPGVAVALYPAYCINTSLPASFLCMPVSDRLPAASTLIAAPASSAYLPVLTGIRVVAAYLVYLHHFNPFQEGPGLQGIPERVVREFHVGVPVFFVLSGFLIALRYAGTEQMTAQWWGRYLRNRVARIYPMYFLLTALAFAGIWYNTREFSPTLWLLNVTFLRSFFEEHVYSGVAQGWTLTVEECFYLSAPLIFLLVRWRPRLLWLLPPLLLGAGALLVLGLGPLLWHGLFGNLRFMLLFTFFGRATEFFVGIQLARWFRQGRLQAKAGCYRTVAGLLAMGFIVLLLMVVRGPYTFGQEHPVGIVLNNVVLPLGIALWFAGLLTEDTLMRRVLSTPLAQVLGRSSYVFYLIHMGVMHSLVTRLITTQPLLVFLLLNVVAVGLHYLLEEPLNGWLRKARLPRWRAAA
ncbi:Peptidoglycan/LPS O-acetylase OafA/YrhL, contains acyltransferase and SGNH-hydrolase domains [Hymenobacter actinosclerus]|uniref:Peptidoglycan/LPS O-acetylase OafA/YrhL, contains acyltransferase and SGNH-hydrolase domains n=2 Tax=Hymenobacter actinosclerus TaxID=82805 RepID=A0A1I0GJ00_9BACT|nr:Peptidoglycan/LPS O-acetylase OafA/YrhL, contains acyltransferase and SGNH-hydrolase domains [Hymenobacter actinosclerus]